MNVDSLQAAFIHSWDRHTSDRQRAHRIFAREKWSDGIAHMRTLSPYHCADIVRRTEMMEEYP